MSHLNSGVTITDIEALALVVKAQCPELELVRQKTYRTWITDHGSLVGDYPLPGLYQVKLLARLKKQGVDVHAKAKARGVELPANLLELEQKPWDLKQQKKLLEDPEFATAYKNLTTEIVGKDAEFVIRYKEGKGNPKAYEIGLVPHPVRKGEYVMMTDFYCQGNGLLEAKGVGRQMRKGEKDTWGDELKMAYSIRATERIVENQMKAGNPNFAEVTKTTLADGRVMFEIKTREA